MENRNPDGIILAMMSAAKTGVREGGAQGGAATDKRADALAASGLTGMSGDHLGEHALGGAHVPRFARGDGESIFANAHAELQKLTSMPAEKAAEALLEEVLVALKATNVDVNELVHDDDKLKKALEEALEKVLQMRMRTFFFGALPWREEEEEDGSVPIAKALGGTRASLNKASGGKFPPVSEGSPFATFVGEAQGVEPVQLSRFEISMTWVRAVLAALMVLIKARLNR